MKCEANSRLGLSLDLFGAQAPIVRINFCKCIEGIHESRFFYLLETGWVEVGADHQLQPLLFQQPNPTQRVMTSPCAVRLSSIPYISVVN